MSLLNPQNNVTATRLEPIDLLAALCGLVSSDVQVYIHEPGWPYRAQFSASLARVQSLVPGRGAIIFEFEGGESLSLGPSEVVDFHTSPTGVQPAWVELELRCGSCCGSGESGATALADRDTGHATRSTAEIPMGQFA